MPDLFDRNDLSPPTRYICWLLQSDRTRAEAGKEARRLRIDLQAAEYWHANIRRRCVMEGKAAAQGMVIGGIALIPILLLLEWVMK